MSGQTNTMEIGMSTFLHANPGNSGVSHAERLRQAIEEVQLADQVGLDVYAVGEHHRIDYTSRRQLSFWPPLPLQRSESGSRAQ